MTFVGPIVNEFRVESTISNGQFDVIEAFVDKRNDGRKMKNHSFSFCFFYFFAKF